MSLKSKFKFKAALKGKSIMRCTVEKRLSSPSVSAEYAFPSLSFDDGLVAGPEEVFLPDGFRQSAALHHVVDVIVDSREHKRAALLVESFMQTMNGFDACCIYQ